MADMAVQCFAGNSARGMSLVSLHNGGGVGIGRAINGGFGLVLDGSQRVNEIISSGILWDVMGGVARRNWARNKHAMQTVKWFNSNYNEQAHITEPNLVSETFIEKEVSKTYPKGK